MNIPYIRLHQTRFGTAAQKYGAQSTLYINANDIEAVQETEYGGTKVFTQSEYFSVCESVDDVIDLIGDALSEIAEAEA